MREAGCFGYRSGGSLAKTEEKSLPVLLRLQIPQWVSCFPATSAQSFLDAYHPDLTATRKWNQDRENSFRDSSFE